MKHVTFKNVPFVHPVTGEKGIFSYRDALLIAVAAPLDGKLAGMDEMRSSIRLLDVMEKLDKDAQGCDFEDADFKFLQKKVRAMKFKFNSKVFLQFLDVIGGETNNPQVEFAGIE